MFLDISSSNKCDLVREGDCVHIHYYPDFKREFLYEHFSNERMAVLFDGNFYIGQIVEAQVFETYSNGKKVIFDLKNIELYNIFHLISVYY